MASSFDHAKVQEGFRARCEDRAQVYHLGDHLIAVVADGVGGQKNGERAAEMVLEAVAKSAPDMATNPMDQSRWKELLATLDKKLLEDNSAGQSTAIVCVADHKRALCFAVGDSGAWMVRSRDVVDLTAGTAKELFLGSGIAEVSVSEAEFGDGTLLLASDGLFKFADDESITRVVRGDEPKLAVKKLFQVVLQKVDGFLRDDFAAVLVRPKEVSSFDDEMATPLPVRE